MRFKKTLAVLLCALLISALFLPTASAEKAQVTSGETTVLSYNVAGLPLIKNGRNPWSASKQLSLHFAEGDYDLIGVQEDFNCHSQLTSKLGSTMPYVTQHQGLVPAGDGLGLLSKHPIYNQTNVGWEESFGVFSGSSDELTPKGFLHTVVCLTDDKNGPKVDFFTLHADAGGDEKSIAAREANFRQLAAYINKNCKGRAVIVTGDFNTHYNVELERVPASSLVTDLVPDLRDSWYECTQLKLPAGQPAGVRRMPENGDSIDHIMVRDGGGITLTFVESKNLNIQLVSDKPVAAEGWVDEENQRSLSDHSARYAKLSWEYDSEQAFDYEELLEPGGSKLFGKQLKAFFRTLGRVISEPFK